MKSILLLLIISLPVVNVHAQIVNGYAEVTGIAGNVLTLSAVDEAAHTFEDNEWIVIMQMQDNVIGDVTNTVNFGNLGSINSCGVYEIRQISSHTETAGTPTSITLMNSPNFTYNICANCQVQIITFRTYGAPDYTTTANMSAKPWDGRTGGVLAFYVPGILTLQNNLDADLAGFRGAGPNAGGSAGCQGNSNFRVANQANMADKGESIYKNTTAGYAAGMGKILNGGGGGNSHNGGGGGGGNFTAGGNGGPGWNNCSPGAGGRGGLSLQTSSSVSQIFMGGGGGAGEGNNNLATDGGIGGGIILIKADEITTGACAGITITANGEDISFAGNDGGGGGGAGGTIVFEVNTWNITGGCPIAVEANGGDGGDVNSGGTHGGGGGGGQGAVYYSTTEPTTNVTTATINGVGGCDNNSSPCNSQAGNGGGADGDGVSELLTGPLPIELLSFDAFKANDMVRLEWITASESNNDYFTVQHSLNAIDWTNISQVEGAENSSQMINYDDLHENPRPGLNYYRLKQTDFDGSNSYSEIRSVFFEDEQTLIYPNPTDNELNIFKPNISNYQIKCFNALGQEIAIQISLHQDQVKIDVSNIAAGTYLLILVSGETHETVRFDVMH